MKFSITIPDIDHFKREEFTPVDINAMGDMKDADEVSIGDLLWHVESPKDFLESLKKAVSDDTLIHLENYFIYEICRNLLSQLITTASFNELVYKFGYKRIYDNIDTIKLLRHSGFEPIHESIESNRMCISFKKAK
jgi:hypothetical protein